MAEHFNKKKMLFWGMLLQSIAFLFMSFSNEFTVFVILAAILGLGTAMVYPTFLAGIADFTHPQQRAKSIGVFRLWRDLGYAIGAVLTGIIADLISINMAIIVIGILTFISAFIILIRMDASQN
jgi:MFS family permease